MDIQMPEMDGLEATKKIREISGGDEDRAVPIIAMTAHASEKDRTQSLEAGMNDFVSKPVSPEMICRVLKIWLPDDGPENGEEGKSGNNGDRSDNNMNSDGEQVGNHLEDISTFDPDDLSERMMGDDELIQTVARGFIQDMPNQIMALKGYLDQGDSKKVERAVHSIKGSSASVGGKKLRALAADLEWSAKEGDLDQVSKQMTEFEAEVEQLRSALRPMMGDQKKLATEQG